MPGKSAAPFCFPSNRWVIAIIPVSRGGSLPRAAFPCLQVQNPSLFSRLALPPRWYHFIRRRENGYQAEPIMYWERGHAQELLLSCSSRNFPQTGRGGSRGYTSSFLAKACPGSRRWSRTFPSSSSPSSSRISWSSKEHAKEQRGENQAPKCRGWRKC